MDYVAYYRVSTKRQSRSGLGLDAQRQTIISFLEPDDRLAAEFVEAVSGRNDDRQELAKAICLAHRTGAALLIAKLDRFSRRVSFIANMMESGVRLVVADMPNATDFQLHIFAALAQEERRMISMRTKAALAQAKQRGVALGVNGRRLAVENAAAADNFAAQLRENLQDLQSSWSYSAIARHLNQKGIKTRTGSKFHAQTVKNYLTRKITATI